jgi:acetyl esterase/lipase
MKMLWIAITAGLIGSVSAGNTNDAPRVTYRTDRDIAYVTAPAGDEYRLRQCRLDVYCPEGIRDFATVIWFHAGGLKHGSRYVPGELMNRGFAVVAVDYRLNPQVKAPAYIEDAAAATAWVFRNIEQYGGSPDRIVIAGASAGGYLSTMVGLDKSWLATHGIDADRLAGIVSLSGQAITHVAVREEQGIERTRPVIDRWAPLYHVRGDAPPLLIVTGDRELELLGRYEENAYLLQFMNRLHITGK